jgi:hypothetical protein
MVKIRGDSGLVLGREADGDGERVKVKKLRTG